MRKSRWLALVSVGCLLLISAGIAFAATYTVQPGDTLTAIAARFNTTVSAIVVANNIPNPNLIHVGQVLEVPEGGAAPAPAPPTQPAPSPPSEPAPAPPSGGSTYTVRPGDSLSRIAAQFGTTVAAIAQANNIANVNLIHVGQVLTIPGGTGAPAPPPGDSQPAPAPLPPPTTSAGFEIGGQTQSFGHKDRMREAGMTWVKFQHKWNPGDSPDVLISRIQDAHNNGFRVLLSVTGANIYPAPGSIDFNAFVEFMRGLAAHGPDAIEVWNEMNIDFEWPAGEISPSSYVNNLLAPSYRAIKGANPNVMVVTGALAPTGFDNGTNAWSDARYLAGMSAAGAAGYADCIGVHHNAGATSPSATSGHPADNGAGHYSWYFQPTLNLYYNSFGGARKVCFTEIGYLSGEGFPGLSGNFSWASGTSVSEHAQWLTEAERLAAGSGRVRLFIIYNVDFTQYDASGDPQAGYAIVRPDGSCPACDLLP